MAAGVQARHEANPPQPDIVADPACPIAKHIAMLLPNLAGGGAERVSLTLAGALAHRGMQVDLVLGRKRGELPPDEED